MYMLEKSFSEIVEKGDKGGVVPRSRVRCFKCLGAELYMVMYDLYTNNGRYEGLRRSGGR